MCDLYAATPELTGALTALATETKAKGWWHSYGDAIPDWFELYVGLESAASAIRRYDEALIPGILQSRAYALAVYQLEVILAEAALLRTVGDAATMAEQLRHLLKVGELPNLSIRVHPLSAGIHRGAGAGTFVILDFPAAKRTTPEPPVVYCESWTGALYLDRPEEYAAYEQVWASLDDLALDEAQSRQLINKIIGEIHRG